MLCGREAHSLDFVEILAILPAAAPLQPAARELPAASHSASMHHNVAFTEFA